MSDTEIAGKTGTRSQEIIRTSIVGIAANVLLAAFKAAVGLLANSVAIVMDAVNNLSDALSRPWDGLLNKDRIIPFRDTSCSIAVV